MTRYSARALLGVCGLIWIGCSLAACSQQADGPKRTYTVRGEIVQLPGADSVEHAMLIRHEAIPDFMSAEGEVVGMMSMTMPFPVAVGVSLDGLQVGDAVVFTFEMDWKAPKGADPYRVTKIEKLPADTKLEFGMSMKSALPEAAPGASAPAVGEHEPHDAH